MTETYTPNAQLLRSEGIRIVYHLPREVRKELMAGVKAGHLGHLRKQGLMPEMFFRPDCEAAAHQKRLDEVHRAADALKAVCV